MMTYLLLLLGLGFVLLPLPLCLYLLVKKRETDGRILGLEKALGRLVSARMGEAPKAELVALDSQGEDRIREDAVIRVGSNLEDVGGDARDGGPRMTSGSGEREAGEPCLRVPTEVYSETQGGDQAGTASRSSSGKGGSIMSFLRSIGMYPPEMQDGYEVGIFQWLLPRVGGLFAVLSTLFFAVYVSRNTGAWVRFGGVMAVSGVVLGAGVWIRRRNPNFGEVMGTIGLAMLYTSVVAGYAAPAIKVISSPWLGILLQIAVVVFSVRLAESWGNRGCVLLALILASGTAVFGALEGLQEAALVAGLLVAGSGGWFAVKWDWKTPLIVGIAGAAGPLIAWVFQVLGEGLYQLPFEEMVIGYVGVMILGLWGLLNVSLGPVLRAFGENGRLIGVCGGIVLLGGYMYSKWVSRDLAFFYGSMALIHLLPLVLNYGQRRSSFTVYAMKVSLLTTLWMVASMDGEVLWVSLMLQSVSLSVMARERRNVWIEGLALLTLVYASGTMMVLRPALLPVEAFWTWLYPAYAVVGVFALGWLKGGFAHVGWRRWLYGFMGIGVSWCVWLAIRQGGWEAGTQIGVLAVLAASCAMLVRIPGMTGWAPFHAYGVLLFGAVMLTVSIPHYPLASTAVVLVSLMGVFALWYWRRGVGLIQGRWGEWLLNGYWVTALHFTVMEIIPLELKATWGVGFALVLMFLSARMFRSLADWVWLPIVIFPFETLKDMGDLWTGGVFPAVGLVVLSVLGWFAPARSRRYRVLGIKGLWTVPLVTIPFVWWVFLSDIHVSWLGKVMVLILMMGGYLVLTLYRRRSALLLGWGLCLGYVLVEMIHSRFAGVSLSGEYVPSAAEFLSGGGAISLAGLGTLCFCMIWDKRRSWADVGNFLSWMLPVVSIGGMMLWVTYRELGWSVYYTPVWASIAFVGVALGFLLRARPLRLVSLSLLLIPMTRLFTHDVTQALHRILAFGALAVLFLALGYLYQRLSKRLIP